MENRTSGGLWAAVQETLPTARFGTLGYSGAPPEDGQLAPATLGATPEGPGIPRAPFSPSQEGRAGRRLSVPPGAKLTRPTRLT